MPWSYVVTFLFGVLTGVVSLSLVEIALSGWEERER